MLAVLLAIALAVPTAAAAPVANQIDNESFEEWNDDGPAEWRVDNGTVESTSEAYEGDRAALLNAVGDDPVTTLAQEVSLDENDAPIVPNAEYEIDFAALFNSGTSTPSTEEPDAFGQIVWKNTLGETSRVDRVAIADTDDYLEYNETFRAPADATAADVQFHLVREDATDRTDANLKVDAVAFGPAEPVDA